MFYFVKHLRKTLILGLTLFPLRILLLITTLPLTFIGARMTNFVVTPDEKAVGWKYNLGEFHQQYSENFVYFKLKSNHTEYLDSFTGHNTYYNFRNK